jgi:hypothetical protein
MPSAILKKPVAVPAVVMVTPGNGSLKQLRAVVPEGYVPPHEAAPQVISKKPDFLIYAEAYSGNPHHEGSKRLITVKDADMTEPTDLPFADGLYLIQHSANQIEVEYESA